MATAQRPARGGGSASSLFTGGGYFMGGTKSHARSVQSVPQQLHMKTRAVGQTSAAEVQVRDLRRELEERERAHFESVLRAREKAGGGGRRGGAGAAVPALQDAPGAAAAAASAAAPALREDKEVDFLAAFDDADDNEPLLRREQEAGGAEASGGEEEEEGGGDDDGEEEEDEEDDFEEIQRELENIRRQREEERQRRAREAEELAERQQADGAARSNPLLAGALGGGAGRQLQQAALKRRFGDDTVFSGTHAAEPEHGKKARFINDTQRSDFSRRFMARYVL